MADAEITPKKKKGGPKKKKLTKAEIKEAEKVAREAAAEEAARVREEEEAAARARAEINKAAKALMKQAIVRKGVVRGTEDELGPFEIWRLYEGTRLAIWKARLAFVEPEAEEFMLLRKRLGEEKELLAVHDAAREERVAELADAPKAGAGGE